MSISNSSYWLIELLAYWEGQIKPAQLANYWQCSRQNASKKLNDYNDAYRNLNYCARDKSYHPSAEFKPKYLNSQASEYLHWASTGAPASTAKLPIATLPMPSRNIQPQLMRMLVQALREQRRLEVNYLSLSNPNEEGRIIVPHHFVSSGLRWHLRAWCEKSSDYRDFVLSRFRGIPELLETSTQSVEQDKDWNTELTLILEPDIRLSPVQRQVIEQDYDMQHGQLQLKVRACLLSYVLQNLKIHPHIQESDPKAQQLVIVNKADIKNWIFG